MEPPFGLPWPLAKFLLRLPHNRRMAAIGRSYPGESSEPADIVALAHAYRRVAKLQLEACRRHDPMARAPFRLLALHAIELYLNALLRASGEPQAAVPVCSMISAPVPTALRLCSCACASEPRRISRTFRQRMTISSRATIPRDPGRQSSTGSPRPWPRSPTRCLRHYRGSALPVRMSGLNRAAKP